MDRTTLSTPNEGGSRRRVAFLGPPGTFTEEALFTRSDLADGELLPLRSMPEVLATVEGGGADVGFVAIENSIEGTVNLVIDALVFDNDLLVQLEVVHEITENLLVSPGTTLDSITRVVSFPNALG